jgi:hypothetical protein
MRGLLAKHVLDDVTWTDARQVVDCLNCEKQATKKARSS